MPKSVAVSPTGEQSRPSCRGGLTSRQAWTLQHIARCSACGSWVLLTDRELTGDVTAVGVVCRHFRVGE